MQDLDAGKFKTTKPLPVVAQRSLVTLICVCGDIDLCVNSEGLFPVRCLDAVSQACIPKGFFLS